MNPWTARPGLARAALSYPSTSNAATPAAMPHRTNMSGPTHKNLYDCDVYAERLEDYRPGGYHPVKIGDVLHNGRYEILAKLGWGAYATVWAAKDDESVSDTFQINCAHTSI